ncbi:MAG: hypothetical protein A2636_06395 [Elusimicrobia bacterium RIFCSPHIGHO2_01_FULL_64_10]|nr:MAG: hypothetical protein A2636_06395 [Elusimicrobia bacterium RIFCSPHIGHO2_01_FULL_64_10]
MTSRILPAVLAGLVLSAPVLARSADPVRDGIAAVRARLQLLRASPEDLSNPARWTLPHTTPHIEEFLTRPVDAPAALRDWCLAVRDSEGPGDDIARAGGWLGSGEVSGTPLRPADPLPGPVPEPAREILEALRMAESLIRLSIRDLSGSEREDILALHEFPSGRSSASPLLSPRFKRAVYKSLEKFDQAGMLRAAELAARSVEKALPDIRDWSSRGSDWTPGRRKTPAGDLLIGGPGDDRYSPRDLEGVALLIDLGGNNLYSGAAAGARTGEAKVVIDLGSEVEVDSAEPLAAGGGVFGVGLFYLDGSSGTKTVRTGSFSQGYGLCGVGALFARGKGTFSGERYVQGSGTFGLGIFRNASGPGSAYSARLYSQGVGFTRGAGVFFHRGSDASLRAGLVDPDPREPLGATSLCQGVGYGPRAYAGGGLGICVISGDRVTLESSYFAQGAGYWHSAGAFFIEGSSNVLQARRYDQGSGIHSAAGAFFLHGDRNRAVNWGVGPAFGWDRGLGWAVVTGNENTLQADWGAGTASINRSRSFFVLSGDRNRMDLPGLGTAHFSRDSADYAVSVIRGEDNLLKSPQLPRNHNLSGTLARSPWCVLESGDLLLSPSAQFVPAKWEKLPWEEAAAQKRTDLSRELLAAGALPPPEKVERLIRIAAAFSPDKAAPRTALRDLVSLPDAELDHIMRSLDPADFDGIIQIRAAIGAIGAESGRSILKELKETPEGERRAWLLAMLSGARAADAVPQLLAALDEPDWRIRATAVRVLGNLLSAENGSEPGRLTVLASLERALARGNGHPSAAAELARGLASKTFSESASALSAAGPRTVADRLRVLECAPEDISGNMSEDQAGGFLGLLRESGERARENVRAELERSRGLRDEVRKIIAAVAEEEDLEPELLSSAITALGKIGNGEDALLVSGRLDHPSAMVRESASQALGLLGRPSLKYLKKAMRSPDPSMRVQALCSLAQTSEPALAAILEDGLADADPAVRRAALSVLPHLQRPLSPVREKILKRLRRGRRGSAEDLIDLERLFLFGS